MSGQMEALVTELAKHYPFHEDFGDGWNEPHESVLWCTCGLGAKNEDDEDDEDDRRLATWVQTAGGGDPGFERVFAEHVRDALLAAGGFCQEPDREALAKAAHHYFCIRRSEPNHDPDRDDYGKADEILAILALIGGDPR